MTPAFACRKALTDATVVSPNRAQNFEGIMGDASHQTRKSDHNSGNAFDLTHDPAHGIDCNILSKSVIYDRRVKYVIWNRRIYEVSKPGLGWQVYTGINGHTHHMHVSIHETSRNDLSPWIWNSPLYKFYKNITVDAKEYIQKVLHH